jgi:alpha-tubulin suppressor-like RCC1 family protein
MIRSSLFLVTVVFLAGCGEVVLGSREQQPTDDGGGEAGAPSPQPDGGPAATPSQQAITVGQLHACKLETGKGVSCWGMNSYGGLGDGTKTNRSTPVSVAGLPPGNPVEVTAGAYHTCVRFEDGTVACWGGNSNGQLGDGTPSDSRLTPALVPGLTDVVQLALGPSHTCALTKAGAVLCWGWNVHGQVGNGTVSQFIATPTVVGVPKATQIALGFQHTCARLEDGTARCWGYNGFGNLGDGTTETRPAPATVVGLSNVRRIELGVTAGSTCAILEDASAQCWGANQMGELGNGTFTNASTPKRFADLNVKSMAVGSSFTCAVVEDGTVQCSGSNEKGQHGDGTTSQQGRLTPAAVPGVTGAWKVFAGQDFACALVTSGKTKCWGANAFGQFGLGSEAPHLTPVDVAW